MVISEDWRKVPSDHTPFFDQDVRADCLCLVEEGRTTCTEEFWDVDGGCANELIFAAHRNFVCRVDIG
jgi:hypothetical protein